MATDFTFKSQIDPTSIARLAQDQATKQAALDQEAKQGQANNILAAAKAATDMVSASIEASKNKQKRDAINSLASSLASQVPDISRPQMGPSMGGGSLPNVMTPDLNRQEGVRSAVNLAPESFAKSMAEQMFPSASGSANKFGGGIPVVNATTGERSFLQLSGAGQSMLANGQPYSPEWQREYAPTVMADPVSQQPTLYPKTPGAAAQAITPVERPTVGTYAKRSLKERAEIRSTANELKKDELLQSSGRVLETVGLFDTLINQDLAAAKGPISGLANRFLNKEVGTSTEGDISRASGGQDVETRFKQLLRTAADGKLTDQNFAEFKSLAATIKQRASEQYDLAQSQSIETLMMEYDLSEKEAKTLLKYRTQQDIAKVQGKGKVETVDRPVKINDPGQTAKDGWQTVSGGIRYRIKEKK